MEYGRCNQIRTGKYLEIDQPPAGERREKEGKMMNEVKAVWTGKYPNLCGGTWYLEVNGHDVSEKYPLTEDTRRCTHINITWLRT